jgi:hypothetical protein
MKMMGRRKNMMSDGEPSAFAAISPMYQLFHSGWIQEPVTGRPRLSCPQQNYC